MPGHESDPYAVDALGDQLPDAALWLSADAVVVSANHLAERLLDLPAADLTGQPLRTCCYDDDGERLEQGLRGDDGPGLPELVHVRTRSGRPLALETTFLRGLRPDATLLILRDAGDATRHAARIRMITAATEQVSEGIAIVDRRDGGNQLVWANPAFHALLGFDEGASAPTDLLAAQFHDALDALEARRAFEDGEVSGRGALTRIDGGQVVVRYAFRPLDEGRREGAPRWWVCTFLDTTEQDRVDRMLQEQQAVTRDARDMAALGDMVAGIAHDFNNSITVIRNLALLSSAEEDLTRVREDLASIIQASDDAAQLARSLTAFGRRGAQQNREEVFDFDETVAQIVQVVGRGLRLKLEIETDLRCGARIRSRPGMLQQVLYNLMINARDAIEERGLLTVRTRRIGSGIDERVELTVADDGPGMSEEVREQAFVPYFTTKGEAGTGLGLAKVHYMLHQNRGTISVESRPGEGARFVIRLPVEPASETRAARSGSALLIDDDPAIRKLLPQLLARRDVACPTVASGADAEALELVDAPDLVIVDLMIGPEDGRDVARTLRARWPEARFVLTTGADLPRPSSPPAPFDYVLRKPFAHGDVDAMLAYFSP